MNNSYKNVAFFAVYLISGVTCSLGMALERSAEREVIVVALHGCPPCEKLGADLRQGKFEKFTSGKVSIRKIYSNDPEKEEIEKKYGVKISQYPTTLVIENGKMVGKIVGYDGIGEHWKKISRYLSL